jgi:enoyl-CoA hydratase/carnithine racemase
MIRELIGHRPVGRRRQPALRAAARPRQAFCAGADLAWMQQSAQLDFNTNLDDAHELAS